MKTGKTLGATVFIGAATLLSRALGLIREQIFAYFFGATLAADAFQIAFRIPNLLRDLFAEGAMSSALVPIYTRSRLREGEAEAWSLLKNLITVLALLTFALSILGCIFADSLVHFYAPGFAAIAGKRELTIKLTRILWAFFPCVVFAAVWMGALNARERFSIPALASSVFNAVSILGMLIFCPLISHYFGFSPIYGVALAVLLGGLGQWLMQVPALRREGFSYIPQMKLRDPKLLEVLWLMGAGTFGMAATQINILVNSFLASGAGPGAVSWLHYAFRLMQFPIGVFGVAIATTTLTKVSKEVAERDFSAVSKSLQSSLRMVFVLTIPSSIGLAILGVPIISLIFEHGKFFASDTRATATALAGYALGLSAYSIIKVLVPVYYALGRSKLAIGVSTFSIALNISLCFLLKEFGFWAFPLATSLSSLLHCFLLLLFLRGRLVQLDYANLFRCVFTVLLCSVIMGALLVLFLNRVSLPLFGPIPLTGLWPEARFPLRFTLLFVALGGGVATYIASAKVLGLHEISRLNELLWK